MFSIASDIKYIEASPEEILELYRSTNESLVQIPGLQGETSEAFLISLNRRGNLEIYLFFFLKESIKGVVYRYTEPVTKSNYLDVRNQGLYFLESMGFIMENTDFRKLPEKEKVSLMESLPPFHPDLSKFAPKKTTAAEEEDEEEAIEVEVLEEDLETIHELDTINEFQGTTGSPTQQAIEEEKLTPEMIQQAMEKNRNLRIFFLFLAGI